MAKPVFVGLRAALDVTSLPIRTLGTIARERAVARLLGSLLPQPWATIARIFAGALLLPDAIKRESLRLLLDVLARLLHPESPFGEDLRAEQRLVRPARVRPQAQACRPIPAASLEPTDPSDRQPGEGQEHLFSETPFDVVIEAELDATEGPLPGAGYVRPAAPTSATAARAADPAPPTPRPSPIRAAAFVMSGGEP